MHQGRNKVYQLTELGRKTPGSPGQILLDDLKVDLQAGQLEGSTVEVQERRLLRVKALAETFYGRRAALKQLFCDQCDFDPSAKAAEAGIEVRSLFDVHHKVPLHLGERRSTEDDFELLCPTCHRFTHARMRVAALQVRGEGHRRRSKAKSASGIHTNSRCSKPM
ncbi:HNH endonuclease [Sabulicella glaciei]|uniref:HNH endonuclease n=1 Tax=Sabulicella glaciei TaxID=2984948 RepID=UPI0034A05C83